MNKSKESQDGVAFLVLDLDLKVPGSNPCLAMELPWTQRWMCGVGWLMLWVSSEGRVLWQRRGEKSWSADWPIPMSVLLGVWQGGSGDGVFALGT